MRAAPALPRCDRAGEDQRAARLNAINSLGSIALAVPAHMSTLAGKAVARVDAATRPGARRRRPALGKGREGAIAGMAPSRSLEAIFVLGGGGGCGHGRKTCDGQDQQERRNGGTHDDLLR